VGFTIVIPARFASTRFPGKLLQPLAGKAVIQHVFECAQQSGAGRIIIATDDERIQQAAAGFDAEVCMTSAQHQSGTERIHEVITRLKLANDEIIVNYQGDEPLMPAACLNQVASLLAQGGAEMATLSTPIVHDEDIFDSNIVKVATDKNGLALYFSRAPIPWQRGAFETRQLTASNDFSWQRHIGLYAYRAGYLVKYIALAPSPLEKIESLEQLRVLWHGGRIIVGEAVEVPGPGIDTPEDLSRAEQLLK